MCFRLCDTESARAKWQRRQVKCIREYIVVRNCQTSRGVCKRASNERSDRKAESERGKRGSGKVERAKERCCALKCYVACKERLKREQVKGRQQPMSCIR